jgi:aldose 1-epimerase
MKKIIQLMALTAAGLGAAFFVGCETMSHSTSTATKQLFGKMPDGTPIDIYTLTNSHGMEARIMTYGGIVVSLKAPDKNGNLGDVVLGFDNLDSYTSDAYIKGCPYFGALIGRYGNRIANGKFSLDGQTYTLATNNAPNTLHGGLKGFDKKVWTARPVSAFDGAALILAYVSKNGEEGFPGNLEVTATYTLTEKNELRLEFVARTDRDTVVNLTHHSYFNLRGSGDVLDHVAQINADYFTPVDSTLIPTGKVRAVAGTPFDFLQPTPIGLHINDTNDDQIKIGNGYDHNFVLNKIGHELSLAARVEEPTSGRTLEVWTTEPGVQFYTGNFLDGTLTGKGGWVYQFRNGFCFEPQHFPDSPNQPQFPTTELKPGQTYHSTFVYKFGVK